jgi:type II secretory pathway pseudopilin PulG
MTRRGITVLEVLVVLAIAVFALGLMVVLIARHRENAQRLQCKNNLRLIGLAFQAYHDASSADKAHKRLPPSRIAEGYASWAVLLAPHLLKENALQQWDPQLSYFAQMQEVREARLIMYFCPARIRSDTLSQAGDVDNNTLFPGGLGDYACIASDNEQDWTGPKATGALVIADLIERKEDRIVAWQSRTGFNSLPRGTQYTMLVGEKHVPADHLNDAAFGDGSLYNAQNPASFSRIAGPGFPLAKTPDAPFNKNFGSYHNGICNFLMADTSVRSMATDVSEVVLGQLANRGE